MNMKQKHVEVDYVLLLARNIIYRRPDTSIYQPVPGMIVARLDLPDNRPFVVDKLVLDAKKDSLTCICTRYQHRANVERIGERINQGDWQLLTSQQEVEYYAALALDF